MEAMYDGYQTFMIGQLSDDPREGGFRIEGDSLCDPFLFLDTLVMPSCGWAGYLSFSAVQYVWFPIHYCN